MSKDVILDKYARLYEIPNQLALLGHEVECFCLSYQRHGEGIWDETNAEKKLKWYSKSYIGIQKAKILAHPFILLEKLKKYQPDLIIAASDIPHIVMGSWIAKKLNRPFIADLYDNFEAYGQAKIPGLKLLFHKALDSAQLISTTSISLAEKIKIEHPTVPRIFPMPSVINKELFKFGDKLAARKVLNLPLGKELIGTAGGLTKMKGVDDLFKAWKIIRQEREDIYLVLAGPTEEMTPLPDDDRVIYLGLLPHKDIVNLFQALDVGVLCIPDDAFGKYCFPQKAYEMIATGLPIVSTAVGDMTYLLAEHSAMLYSPEKYEELSKCILTQIHHSTRLNIEIPDWRSSIKTFESYFPDS